MRPALALVALLGLASLARAEPEPLAMDRTDDRRRYAVQLDSTLVREEDERIFGERLEFFGQHAGPRGGVYGALQLSKAAGDFSDELAIGNLEVGGIVAGVVAGGLLTVRLGLALGIAPDDGGAASGLIATLGRVTDVARVLPTTFLRPALTYTTRGPLFVRLDLGVDVAAEDRTGGDGLAIGRGSVGGGLVHGSFAYLAELCAITPVEEIDPGRVLQPVIGVRYLGPRVSPAVALSTVVAEEIGFGRAVTLSIGISGAR